MSLHLLVSDFVQRRASPGVTGAIMFRDSQAKSRYTNAMRILLMSAVGVFLFTGSAHAALVYIDPAEGTYGPGDTFIANVRLSTEECVNAVHIELEYPKEVLRAVDFSKGSSILTLWVEEPRIDERGSVSFSGGIPGGYCGRITGDPVVSNILGKIVFTVLSSTTPEAIVHISSASSAYRSDGQGTEESLTAADARIAIAPEATQASDPWLSSVESDTVPPEAFEVEVQSTRGVFDGNYYLVFATVDKQSGLDHYELFENGVWRPVTSPHKLRDQSLQENVQVKAIDKAGNERIGAYNPSEAPERQAAPYGRTLLVIVVIVFIVGAVIELYRLRSRAKDVPVVDV